ncbi:MAG: hypothetical protein VXZ27_04680, partial [SAR324 cluster bacterium]|nr:hypothetical protein [SAR324 cluster bacterium]
RKHFGFKTDYSYVNRLVDTNCLSKAYRENIKYDKKDSLTSWQLRLWNLRYPTWIPEIKRIGWNHFLIVTQSRAFPQLTWFWNVTTLLIPLIAGSVKNFFCIVRAR